MATDAPHEVWHGITRLVRGGAQLVVLDLIAGLDRSRFTPVLLAGPETGSEGSLWPEAEALCIELVRVPSLVRPVAPARDLAALRDLTRRLRERRPALVHAHTSKAGFLLCRAARRATIGGVVLSPHGHIAGTGAQIPGVPSRGWKRRILRSLARRSARDADLIVCPNEEERRDGIAHGMWSEERSVVVPNGIDTERFAPAPRDAARRALGWAVDVPTVGVVARLTREKGIDVAIEAVALLPGVRCAVVGDGPERATLEARARELGVGDRVEFLGVRGDVAAVMPAFDALLVPSRTEAHGMVAVEALACGVPVVASDVGGLRGIVDPDRTGLRVPPDDPAACRAERHRDAVVARRDGARHRGALRAPARRRAAVTEARPVLLLVALATAAPLAAQSPPPPPAIPDTPASESEEVPEDEGFLDTILGIPGDLSAFFDFVHDSVSRQLVERTEDLDQFFGDERIEDDPRVALVRLRLQGTWEEKGEFPTRARVKVRLPFPRTERRLQLVVDSLDGTEELPAEEAKLEEEQDEESFAGLRIAPILDRRRAVSLDLGVRVHSGLEARGELRFQRSFTFGSFGGRALQGFFWREGEGWGERTRIDVEHGAGMFGIARSRSEAEWSEDTRGVELGQSLGVARPLTEHTAILATIGAAIHTRPVWIVDGYSAEIRLRQQLHRRWIFLEVSPGAEFPRERRYEFTPRLRLTLELRFGGERPPALDPTESADSVSR